MKVIIPDIHGQAKTLRVLLDSLDQQGYLQTGSLIFTGDYGDRGPDSRGVHLMVKSLTEAGIAIALLGNHEEMLLLSTRGNRYQWDDGQLWRQNGGGKTIDSYGGSYPDQSRWFRRILDDGVLDWLRGLPLFYEDSDIWCSHAPVSRHPLTLEVDKSRDSLLWNSPYREGASEDLFAADLGKRQIVGHIPSFAYNKRDPRFYPHIIYADTGGWHLTSPKLTAIIMEGKKCVGYFTAVEEGVTVFTPREEEE